MAKAKGKPKKGMTEKQDMAMDRKMGMPEGGKMDMPMDKKMGVRPGKKTSRGK